jgi:predicted MFS family arabinose efflux permease
MSPRNSAGTVGLLMVGIGFGGSTGPPMFGTLVEATSYRTAWLATSLGLGLASLAMVVAVRSAPRPR